MTDRPIAFTVPLLEAILEGRRTQTRRVGTLLAGCRPGERLWVREPFHLPDGFEDQSPSQAIANGAWLHFAVDGPAPSSFGRRRFARELPKARHRSHLVLTAVRRERLHAIDTAALAAEGLLAAGAADDALAVGNALQAFARSWNELHAPDGRSISGDPARWADNPMVTVLDFELVCAPLPSMRAAA